MKFCNKSSMTFLILFIYSFSQFITGYLTGRRNLNKNFYDNNNKIFSLHFLERKFTKNNASEKEHRSEYTRHNPAKLGEILQLKNLILQENIPGLDQKVLNDEIYLITKGKIEKVDEINKKNMNKIDDSQLTRLKGYLNAFPKILSATKKALIKERSQPKQENGDDGFLNIDYNSDGNYNPNQGAKNSQINSPDYSSNENMTEDLISDHNNYNNKPKYLSSSRKGKKTEKNIPSNPSNEIKDNEGHTHKDLLSYFATITRQNKKNKNRKKLMSYDDSTKSSQNNKVIWNNNSSKNDKKNFKPNKWPKISKNSSTFEKCNKNTRSIFI